jgi:hypothetical protein
MDSQVDPFAASYAEARAKFLAAASAWPVESHLEHVPGVEHEALAMDVVRVGADDARNVLLVSSACHGVEGFCGSGIQVDLLGDRTFLKHAGTAGVALVFIHALNPWGFSFGRRVTREGVDLNRNFVSFASARRRNVGYDEIADLLMPADWPPSSANERALMSHAQTHGMAAFQQAVSGGQYHHPGGLFYGGESPTWSHRTLRKVLRRHGGRCARLGWVDLHTGLGEPGASERIFAGRADPLSKERAKAWWGDDVTFLDDGSSSSAEVEGSLWRAAYEECPQAEYTGVALEFGTSPVMAVLQALRLDHWVARRGDGATDIAATARAAMRDAFFIDTPQWKAAVLRQGRDAIDCAVRALGRAA